MAIGTRTALNRRLRLVGAAVAIAAASAASADIVIAEYEDDQHFDFQVAYMPDLDQNRSPLPCLGSMFCVPTSTMNLFSYAAEWGFDDLEPGPGVWQGDLSHGVMTVHISDLGELMDTGCDGTSNGGWNAGVTAWLDGFPLTANALYKKETWCPRVSDAAWRASYGGIVDLVYGKYEYGFYNPSDPTQPVLGLRVGGHSVTMAYAHADGPNDLALWVRDPDVDDDGDVYSQGPWVYRQFPNIQNLLVKQDWDNDGVLDYVDTEVTALTYNPDNNNIIRLIDKIRVITPWCTHSWSGIELNIAPLPNGGFTLPPPTQGFVPPPGFVFTDVARNLHTPTYSVLASEGQLTWLMEADPLTGEMQLLATIPGATDIAVGRLAERFVLAGTELYRLSIEGEILQTATLPYPCEAMAYRDATDEIVLLSGSTQRMLIVDPVEEVAVFEDVVPIPPTADPSIAVREADGAVAILVPEIDDNIYGVLVPGPGEPPLLDVAFLPGLDATSVAFDDRDHLVVATAGGQVKEYEPGPADWWDWVAVSPSWYDGVQALGGFGVSRSRTNYDPVMNEVDDIDIPSEELECFGAFVYDCPGDFDNDQLIGVTDLVGMLASWGPCQAGPCPGCPEDLDGDGFIGVTDLITLIGLWGACEL